MRACVLWMASNRPIAKTTLSSLGAYTHAPPVSFPVFRLSPPLLTSHPSSSGFFVSVTFLSFVFPYDRSVDGWLSVWRGPTVVTVVLELPPLFFFFVLEQHPSFFSSSLCSSSYFVLSGPSFSSWLLLPSSSRSFVLSSSWSRSSSSSLLPSIHHAPASSHLPIR